MRKILPIIILIIVILSNECSSDRKAKQNNKSDLKTETVIQVLKLPESGEDTLKTSYFADTVIYIPLETTKESFIDWIKQAWMNDSIILINGYRAGLLMFRQNGKFLRKIGKTGRGPGEYDKIIEFNVIRDTIYISSTGKRSFLRYTFSGNYCDEIKLRRQPAYISSTVDDKLAYYDYLQGKIYVFNNNLSTPDTILVEYGVTIGRYYYGIGGSRYFGPHLQKSHSYLLFSNYITDTIWNISGNKKEPIFILDMKEKLLPYDKQVEFCKGDLQGWGEMTKSYYFMHLVPFSSFMFIFQTHYLDPLPNAIYLINNRTAEIKRFNTSHIYDDIVGKQNLDVIPAFRSMDYLIAFSNSDKKLKELEQNKENKKEVPSPLWLNQMKMVNEGDNEVLAIIKIK